eukprot:g1888.t1
MSWLTDTIGKVREQGSSLVSAAKQVRSRLSSEHGDADAHLESKVLSAVAAGPGAAEQLQLNTAASVSGSIANDAFWQTLLRSRAAELMLQGHSAHHASPASPYDGSALRLLIARVLPDDHAALGQEMVTLITGLFGRKIGAHKGRRETVSGFAEVGHQGRGAFRQASPTCSDIFATTRHC